MASFKNVFPSPFPVIVASFPDAPKKQMHVFRQIPPQRGYVDQGESLCGDEGLYGLDKPYSWSPAIALDERERFCPGCLAGIEKALAEANGQPASRSDASEGDR